MKRDIQRRTVLKSVGTASVAGMLGLAGCTLQESDGNGDGTDGGGDSGQPDTLLVIAYPNSGIQLLSDYYNDYDTDTEILVSDGLIEGSLPEDVGNPMENVRGTAPAAGGSGLEFFTSTYEEEYGEAPGVFNTHSFDAAVLLLLANLAAGENDSAAIQENLRAIANPEGEEMGPESLGEAAELAAQGENLNYNGASGSVNFDENGDVIDTAYGLFSFSEDGYSQDETVESSADTEPVMPDGPPGDGSESGRSVMLGMLMAETGDLGSLGVPIRDAALLAETLFADGTDFEFDTQVGDTATDPPTGINAAENLVNAGYPAVVGALSSGVNLQVCENVLIPNSVVGCSPSSTSTKVTDLEDEDYIFRTAPSDILQGKVMATVAAENLDASSASVLYVNNDYGQTLSNVFSEEFDGTVHETVAFEKGQPSYTTKLETAMNP